MRHRLLLTIAATLVFGSCSFADVAETTTPPSTVPAAGAVERAAWEDLGLDTYRVGFSIRNLNGMGGSPGDGRFEVTVQDGRVSECLAADTPFGGDGFCSGGVPEPIGYLFSRLAAFDPAYTSVIFDNERHFPVSIEYDEPDVADEEYSIKVVLFDEF